jgi:hypothetical protein
MTEDLILQAKNICCINTTDIEMFKKKTKILDDVLNQIEKNLWTDLVYTKKLLFSVENVIFNYGYEAGYNRIIGLEGGKYVNQLLPKLVELGEKLFEGKELLPFLREKLWITNEEPARSNLYKKIHELEKE